MTPARPKLPVRLFVLTSLLVTLAALGWSSSAIGASFTQESTFSRTYWLYVPTGYQAGTPVPLP